MNKFYYEIKNNGVFIYKTISDEGPLLHYGWQRIDRNESLPQNLIKSIEDFIAEDLKSGIVDHSREKPYEIYEIYRSKTPLFSRN